jgi:hypothetical protein
VSEEEFGTVRCDGCAAILGPTRLHVCEISSNSKLDKLIESLLMDIARMIGSHSEYEEVTEVTEVKDCMLAAAWQLCFPQATYQWCPVAREEAMLALGAVTSDLLTARYASSFERYGCFWIVGEIVAVVMK